MKNREDNEKMALYNFIEEEPKKMKATMMKLRKTMTKNQMRKKKKKS
ncbi:hypothetical protein QCB49_06250 [Cetobacterium somerae]